MRRAVAAFSNAVGNGNSVTPGLHLIAYVLISASLRAAGLLVFTAVQPANDLQGPLPAEVKFAQSQTIPITPGGGEAFGDG